MTTIGASIICMDHINFENDVKICQQIGVDYLHLDVMDGTYVPRYGIYPEIVQRIAEISTLPMDLHLMVSNVEFAIKEYRTVKNIEYISIHIDGNEKNFFKYVDEIRSIGKKPCLVANLSSDIKHVAQIINTGELDGLMLMGIHPGVLIQSARSNRAIANLQLLYKLCGSNLPDFIQIDGGVNIESIPKLMSAGATNFICGSSTLYKDVSSNLEFKERLAKVRSNYQVIQDVIGIS